MAAGALWAVAPATPGLPKEGTDYLVDQPDALWRGDKWPVVVSLVPRAELMTAQSNRLRALTSPRGALLITVPSGDEQRFATIVHQALESHTTIHSDIILASVPNTADAKQPGSGWDVAGAWAWQMLLRQPTLFGGCLLVDAAVPEVLEPVPGQAANTPGKAVLLVGQADRLDGNTRLQQTLERWGLTSVVRAAKPEELPAYLGASLTALLPATPPRTQLRDPATGALLKAPPGWHFERRDGFFAVARPDKADDPLVVEVVTGSLGRRSFETYVADVRKYALTDKWIEIVASRRLPVPDDAFLLHDYEVIDRRGNTERTISWYLLGFADKMVSFRAVGPVDLLTARAAEIQALAQGVVFQ
ncbi:MAG: hypothetical protein HZB16_22690 [Armatimonadetes bacterium]|nr:hypothetical protein [Armatimonadota bacterium]